MAKKVKKSTFDIKSIASGALVGEVREATVDFYHNGKIETVDIRIKQLPFSKTESLHSRLNSGDSGVVSDWISLALVDESNNQLFTAEQVENNFTQSLANQIFSEVSGLKGLQEYVEKLGKESTSTKNSGPS